MIARRMLGETRKPGFQKGNKLAAGSRGLPAVRRATNRIFATELFEELMHVPPGQQMTEYRLIIRKVIAGAKRDPRLGRKFLVDLQARFLGSPVQPLLWAALNDPATSAKQIEMIQPHHSTGDAGRIVADMLKEDDEDDTGRRTTLDLEKRLDSGPDDEGAPPRGREPTEEEVREFIESIGEEYTPPENDAPPSSSAGEKARPRVTRRVRDVELDDDDDIAPDPVEDYRLPGRPKTRFSNALDKLKDGR
jgi:hypothetical protein